MTKLHTDDTTSISSQMATDIILTFNSLMKSMSDDLQAKIAAITPTQPNITYYFVNATTTVKAGVVVQWNGGTFHNCSFTWNVTDFKTCGIEIPKADLTSVATESAELEALVAAFKTSVDKTMNKLLKAAISGEKASVLTTNDMCVMTVSKRNKTKQNKNKQKQNKN